MRRYHRWRAPPVEAGWNACANRLGPVSAGRGIGDDLERLARSGQRRLDHRLVVRAGDEAGLVGGGRQEHAAFEHRVEEAVEGADVAGGGVGVGVDLRSEERRVGKESRTRRTASYRNVEN